MRTWYRLSLVPLLLVVLSISACDSTETPDPTPTTGVISGVVGVQVGVSASITNSRVAIYSSFDDWNADRVLRFTAADNGGNYSFGEVTPGSYYADVWLDRNNNGNIDTNDLYGVYGSNAYPNFQPTPFDVSAGQQITISFEAIIIP